MKYTLRKCYYIMANNYLVSQLTIYLYLLKHYLGNVNVLMRGSKISNKIDSNFKINISLFIWTNWINSSSHHLCISWCKDYFMWWQPNKSSFPWKTCLTEDKHLVSDYVHLLKNILNLWLTENTKLIFDHNWVKQVAKWAYLS